jgi:hypothetical protein
MIARYEYPLYTGVLMTATKPVDGAREEDAAKEASHAEPPADSSGGEGPTSQDFLRKLAFIRKNIAEGVLSYW